MTRTRSALATIAGAAALVAGTVVAAPQALAAGEYACTVTSAPSSVRIGSTYTVYYRYTKSSTAKTANWGPANTNPVFQIKNNSTGRWVDAGYNTGATYYVKPGGAVTFAFTRGTASQPTGTHAMRGIMFKASNGSSTYLMSGTPCSHSVTFYR